MHEMLKWVNGMNYLNIEITLIINEQFFLHESNYHNLLTNDIELEAIHWIAKHCSNWIGFGYGMGENNVMRFWLYF